MNTVHMIPLLSNAIHIMNSYGIVALSVFPGCRVFQRYSTATFPLDFSGNLIM